MMRKVLRKIKVLEMMKRGNNLIFVAAKKLCQVKRDFVNVFVRKTLASFIHHEQNFRIVRYKVNACDMIKQIMRIVFVFAVHVVLVEQTASSFHIWIDVMLVDSFIHFLM